jgi:glutamate racemase
MKNKPIGIFDSGIGGLTVLQNLIEELPNEKYIYIGDNKHCPYGDKAKEQLYSYACSIIDYFILCDVKLIVIACNTISSNILPLLINKYPDIKIIGIVESTVNLLMKNNVKKVLVIATSATIESHAYKKQIKKVSNIKVEELKTPSLVPLIEDGSIIEATRAFKNYLNEVSNDFDSLLLGCTHYVIIYDIINSLLEPKIVISSSAGAVNDTKEYLDKFDLFGNEKKIQIYTTGDVLKFVSSSQQFFNYNDIVVKHLNLD